MADNASTVLVLEINQYIHKMLWHEAKNISSFFPPSHSFDVRKFGKKRAQWSVIARAVNDFRQRLVG